MVIVRVRAIDDDELSANVNRKRWSPESEETRPLTKNEKREIYKEYGGRKPRSKGKLSNGVGGGGHRDRGGWDAYNGND